ncbi:chymotrypsin inhibitor [Fopius arisanus]|uniref:Chymotrypsin inhibitor n=1 Tax=Fopius arisanus TaxID=64838 RepID=A0A9R1U6K6_9HYME|nr:PREDICTED: chymotrypsin inhibitor-like [Fopius arisanus]XP_011309102.1 PREDICTED: chymotrypsin inhibitor-like [Fopius arisanus]
MIAFFTMCLAIAFLTTVTGANDCEPHAKLEPCGSLCEAKCGNPDIRLCKINPEGCKLECRCQRPFLRNEKTGTCVESQHCPK